nr:HlyD family secretion protein [Candidatus Dependentiae bacterium]
MEGVFIKSEISGFVKEVMVKEGDFVNENGKIAVITDISKIYAELNVSVDKIEEYYKSKTFEIYAPIIKKKVKGELYS